MSYSVAESYPGYEKHIRVISKEKPVSLTGIRGGAEMICGEVSRTCWDTELPLPDSTGGWWFEREHFFTRPCQQCAKIYMQQVHEK